MKHIRTLIVDDEPAARNRIARLLATEPDIELVGECRNGQEAIEAVQKHRPDLMFLDVQMPQMNGLEVVERIPADRRPFVVFVTAHDQYALKAFDVNAVDYLLKPLKKEDLAGAIARVRTSGVVRDHSALAARTATTLATMPIKRFLIRYGDHFKVIEPAQIAYIHSLQKNTFLRTKEGRDLPLDESLDKLEKQLDPAVFIRLNRQLIVELHSIKELLAYSKSRVKVILEPPYGEDAIVSSERSAEFKRWLSGR